MLDLKKDLEKVEEELISITGLDDVEVLLEAARASASIRRRIALVVDATSSMGPYWKLSQAALRKAVQEIKRLTNVPFQIKVVAYRDRTVDSVFIEGSEWTDDPLYLEDYIEAMTCRGGGDIPESIDVGLNEVMQDNVNQIILIGDAEGRPESPGYQEATDCGQQLKCPIYALWAGSDPPCIKAFKKLAILSGGKAMPLATSGEALEDIFKLIFSKDKGLMITYQATTIEGKKAQEVLQ